MKRFYKVFMVAALLVATTVVGANAQIYYGVKAGANVSTVGTSSDIEVKSDYGYQAGIVVGAQVPIIGIGIEAEGLWINNKMSFDTGGDIISNSFEVPVMASIPVFPLIPISIKVGPSFMLYNDAEVTYEDGTTASLGEVKSSVGYTVGLGLKLLKFTLDVRFNGQFKSSNPFGALSDFENTVSSYDLRTNTFSASVGYRF